MTDDELVEFFVVALKGRTVAVQNVFAPRDWPTAEQDNPILLIQSPIERKESKGRVAPAFDVTATVRVVGRLWSAADAGDLGSRAVGSALGIFKRQIERAIINDYELTKAIQQFVSVDSVTRVSAEGKRHLGELTMDFAIEFYQDTCDFAPIDTNPFEEMALYADLVNVFDKTATYPNPPFPAAVKPAPRTSGPDGRTEVSLDIQLPQPEE